MGNDRLAKNAATLVLLVAVMLAPGTASADGLKVQGKNGPDPAAGYPAPMPMVSPFSGFYVDPTDSGCCYTVPIMAVYQCPAVMTGQPGSRVVYVRTDPVFGLLGGQPYLYHH